MASFLSSRAALPTPLTKPQLACSQAPRPPAQLPQSTKTDAQPKAKPMAADSTDWIASTLTRRFGLGAGLAWAGFLAAGVISEQIKTRIEASQQRSNTKVVDKEEEVILPNGIRYYDQQVGGGASPRPGDLVVIDLQGRVLRAEAGGGGGEDEVFVDTFEPGQRPLALVMGSRPYTRGVCEGVEYALRSMRTGGKRRVVVPPDLGFGDKGADLGGGLRIPAGASLEFVVQVDKVSIAPS